MAISDYSSLKTAIANWLARADLTGAIPDFIQLAQKRISRDLRSHRMIANDGGTLLAGNFALPVEFVALLSLKVIYGGREIDLRPIAPSMDVNHADVTYPYGFVMSANRIEVLGGAGDEAYLFRYWQNGGEPSDDNPSFIAYFPDIYLYASLLEAAPYLKQDARIQTWATGYQAAIEAENRVSNETRWANSPRIKPVHRAP